MPHSERHRSSYNAETIAITPPQIDFFFRGSKQKPPQEYVQRQQQDRWEVPDAPYIPPAAAAIALGGVSRQAPRRQTAGRHTDTGRTWRSIVNTSASLRAAVHSAIEARRADKSWGAIKVLTGATAALVLVLAGAEMKHTDVETLSVPAAPAAPQGHNPAARPNVIPTTPNASASKGTSIDAAPVGYARSAAPTTHARATPTVTVTITETATSTPTRPADIPTSAAPTSTSASPETSDSSSASASPSKSVSQSPTTPENSANPTTVSNSVEASASDTTATNAPRASAAASSAIASCMASASAS